MAVGKEADILAHQFGEQLPLVIGEDALLMRDRMTEWP